MKTPPTEHEIEDMEFVTRNEAQDTADQCPLSMVNSYRAVYRKLGGQFVVVFYPQNPHFDQYALEHNWVKISEKQLGREHHGIAAEWRDTFHPGGVSNRTYDLLDTYLDNDGDDSE
jgi:hypothetical protein